MHFARCYCLQVRYGDVYSVRFRYMTQAALQAQLYQIAVQIYSADSDEMTNEEKTAATADVTAFNALCTSHCLHDAGSDDDADDDSDDIVMEIRSSSKPERKEDIILHEGLLPYLGTTAVYQGKGLNIYEDRCVCVCTAILTASYNSDSAACVYLVCCSIVAEHSCSNSAASIYIIQTGCIMSLCMPLLR
jgi:hypothetical protein